MGLLIYRMAPRSLFRTGTVEGYLRNNGFAEGNKAVDTPSKGDQNGTNAVTVFVGWPSYAALMMLSNWN